MNPPPETPRQTMPTVAPKNVWLFRCIVALVIAAHVFALSQLTGLLVNPANVPPAFSEPVFNTRTIELAPPPKAITAPAQIASPVVTRKKPAASSTSSTATQLSTSITEPASNRLPTNHLASNQNQANTEIDADAAVKSDAQDEKPPEKSPEPEPPTKTNAATRYAVPASAILKYNIKGEIKGFSYFANGQLSWQHNGSNYDAQLEISHFLLGSRTQTSSGQIGERGLVPLRFADKVRTEVVAQLDHGQKQVTFASDASNAPLQDDAQDQLSIFIQLSSVLAGNPHRYKTGDRLPFQAVGSRSSEQWIFEIGETESLALPGGTLQALKLSRNPPSDGAPKVEVWLAANMHYLPVRIRLTQGDGDFVEQEWRSIKKP